MQTQPPVPADSPALRNRCDEPATERSAGFLLFLWNIAIGQEQGSGLYGYYAPHRSMAGERNMSLLVILIILILLFGGGGMFYGGGRYRGGGLGIGGILLVILIVLLLTGRLGTI